MYLIAGSAPILRQSPSLDIGDGSDKASNPVVVK
jgi:hypothetical protein